MDSTMLKQIDLVHLADLIAKKTPQPTTAGEWSLTGIFLVLLLVALALSWYYFIWKEKQSIKLSNDTNKTNTKVNSTMDKLIVHFEGDDTKVVLEKMVDTQNKMLTKIALIDQKISNQ